MFDFFCFKAYDIGNILDELKDEPAFRIGRAYVDPSSLYMVGICRECSEWSLSPRGSITELLLRLFAVHRAHATEPSRQLTLIKKLIGLCT